MSRNEIIGSESTGPISLDTEFLAFESTILGFPCSIFYTFDEAGLAEGGYYIDQSNDVADVNAYLQLQKMLEQKYGAADRDMEWKDPWRERALSTFGELAKAVSTGELTLSAWWNTSETRITLRLVEDKDRYNAIVILTYWDQRRLATIRERTRQRDADLL